MTTPEIVLLILFVAFISGCAVYVARASKRQKAHDIPHPERTMQLEEDQARVENSPSSR